MTDNTEFGTLPRASRDITVLSASREDRPTHAGLLEGGILRPFSGVLEIQTDRGGAQRLDLSYLTLDRLIEPNLVTRTGTTDRTSGADIDPDLLAADTPEPTADDQSEPRVRDLIYGGEDDESGSPTDRQDVPELSGETDQRGPTRELRQFDPTDPPDALDRRVSRGDLSVRTPSDPTRGQSGDDGNSGQFPSPPMDLGADRTLADSSVPTDHGEAGFEQTGTIDPPRMTPEQSDSASGDQTRTASEPSTSASGASESTAASSTETVGQPRMVVDSGSSEEARADNRGRDTRGQGESRSEPTAAKFDQQTDRTEPLSAVIESSKDPQSELVDQLYRALREREAIERSRRGIR